MGILLCKFPAQTYELGIYGAASCSLLLVVIFLQDARLPQRRSGLWPGVPFVLRAVLQVLTICTGFANISLPRRPPVFIEGKPVDSGMTASALSRYSFAWCFPLLSLATKKGTLDLDDLPRPDDLIRAQSLTQRWLEKWSNTNSTGRLWVKLAISHKWPLMTQWFLTLLQSFGNVAPQFVLLHLLRLLERRDAGKSATSEAWIWVIALLLSTFIPAWVESIMFWISQAELTIPIRAELSTLVFQKALRRKDVKGAANLGKDAGDKDDTPKTNGQPATGDELASVRKPKEKEGEDSLTKQSTINLIGVDARRIGDFC